MKNTFYIFPLLAILLFSACNDTSENSTTEQTADINYEQLAAVSPSWVKERVDKAKDKLSKTEGGTIVWNAMEAHGGLERWYNNGPISFHFNYQPLGENSTPRNTINVMNTWSAKARHMHADDTTKQFGWDGEKIWTNVDDSTTFPYNMRVWALTPYYFAAQPFVFDGDGINFEKLDPKEYNGAKHDVVKVTYDAGTGDVPDDYYILYFNSNSHQLAVIRYIVTFKKDGKHSPEKFMALEGSQTIDAITLPKGYKTYMLDKNEQPGDHVTDVTLSEVKFLPELEASYFDVPVGARVVN